MGWRFRTLAATLVLAVSVICDEDVALESVLKEVKVSRGETVVDERTFKIRDPREASGPTQELRIANVAGIAAEAATSKSALARLVAGQVVLWKAAPENVQPPDKSFTLADVWTSDGWNVAQYLVAEELLKRDVVYQSTWDKHLMTPREEQARTERKEKLERIQKEEEEKKAKSSKDKREEKKRLEALAAAEATEPLGVAEYLALGVFLVLVVGAFFNFGRSSKSNPNRKRGLFGQIWSKLKSA